MLAGAKGQPETSDPRVDNWKILAGPDDVILGADGLRRYQIVVLGRDADVFLGEDRIARLREWIAKEGGALVCYRGAPAAQLSQPLARLLPVRWSRSPETRFRVQLTERGRELRLAAAGEARAAGRRAGPTADARPQRAAARAEAAGGRSGDFDGQRSRRSGGSRRHLSALWRRAGWW